MKNRKGILSLILIVISVFAILNTNYNVAIYAKPPMYAQIKNSNTYLYKSAESNQNKWCLIEKSYFVKLISNYNNDYYKAEYNGLTGFVLKADIQLINETPSVPYPIATFNTPNNCYLRKSPKVKDVIDNTICVIPAGSKKLKYIGKIIGEEAVDFKGSIWYLTEYEDNIGYVYSGYTSNVSIISENIEHVSIYTGNTFEKVNPLTNIDCVVIIILTLLPTLLILYMLYKPKKSKKLKVVRKPPSVTDMYDENL